MAFLMHTNAATSETLREKEGYYLGTPAFFGLAESCGMGRSVVKMQNRT
jgi:hypothetical protein